MPIYTLNLIQYITLIFLSVSAGYILHGIVRAIKNGDFFGYIKSLHDADIMQAVTQIKK